MSDLQQQPAPETVIIPDDNAPPEPIEIDLDSGETTEPTPAGAAPPAPPPPKPRNKSTERIQTLSRAVDAERTMREQLARELDEARREAAAARAEAATAMQSGMENYAQRVTSESAAAKEAYKTALTGGDPDAIAEAAAKLSEVSAAKSDVDAWRSQQPAPGQPQPQRPAPQQQQPQPQAQQAPVPPQEVLDFLADNRWFDVYERNEDGTFVLDRQTGRPVANPDFDEDMHDAAMILNKKIERQIRQGTLPREYQTTPEYFQQIHDEMAKQFPDAFGEPEPVPQPQRRTPPMAPTRQPVAPATRTSMPSAPRPGGNKVTLSGEERQFVDSMVANGAMRYPSGHKEAGKPMQAHDAYREYAKQAQITRANQQPQQ